MDIVNELAGNRAPHLLNEDDPSIPVYAAKRRKKSYVKFYKGIEKECIAYRNYDVPAVAAKYLWFWPQIKLKSDTIRRRSFSPEDLLLIEADFRLMIVSSNILGEDGKLVLDGNSVYPAQSTRGSPSTCVSTHITFSSKYRSAYDDTYSYQNQR